MGRFSAQTRRFAASKRSSSMSNADMLKPALLGGVALGILSALPGLNLCNCVCCAWAIGGGILAAYLYVKNSPFPVTMGRGTVTGLAAGAIGAVVCSLFSIPLQLILTGGGNSAIMVESFQELLAKNPDFPDEARQAIETLFLRGDFVALIAIFTFFANLVSFSIFAMIGGAIGVAIFEKRKQDFQQYVIPPQPPQPPADMPPPDNFN
jgi:hypothetical protein